MKIGLRGGHSKNCIGAIGIVNEYEQMQIFYTHVKDILTQYGHEVINCNSNGATQGVELSEGVHKANSNNVDLFISLHMNAFDGTGHGTECLISSTASGSYPIAQKICNNFGSLGFTNRGVKCEALYEMRNIKAPNIIFEICFCDSAEDIEIYNRYSWDQLAHMLCNAIDDNIPSEPVAEKGYIVTSYLPVAYSGYDGVDIKYIISFFDGVKCYVRGNNDGVWIETQYLPINKCLALKETLGKWFYKIEK